MTASRLRVFFVFVVLGVFSTNAFAAAVTITIINKDGAGVGFNDPTAAAPVGGNAGTTLGQQRLNVFTDAANIWASKLAAAAPLTIKIRARFGPLAPCSSSFGIIGSAGPTSFNANFTNAPKANTWYAVATASAISGTNLAASVIDPQTGLVDGAAIDASFNSSVGTAGCLDTSSWYLGLDGNETGNQIDLEATLLHEFGHGLGYLTLADSNDDPSTPLVNEATGNFGTPSNQPDIFAWFMLDSSTAIHWNTMTDPQRLTSMVNNGNVVFDGVNTVAAAATVLSAGKDGSNRPKLYMPSAIEPGSTASHFDKTATPNQLMEPVINHDLTHNVDVPNDLTAMAFKDLGWPQPAGAPNPPTGVVASTTDATHVSLTWTAPAGGANRYHVYRCGSTCANPANFAQVNGESTTTTSYSEAVASNVEYIYKVRSVNASSVESTDSNVDLGVGVAFTDPTLAAGSAGTKLKAAHITELRTLVTSLCTVAGNPAPCPSAFTDASITALTTKMKALHLTELRAKVNAARTALGLSAVTYTDTTVTALATLIKKAHIDDLRNAVR